MAKIIYTHTDEAPLLATYSFLPIIEAYAVDRRASTSRPATSRWPAASSPRSRELPRPRTSGSATPSPSSASWPRRPRPTSSSCPTSRPRSRSSRPPSPSCRRRATTCPTTPTTRTTDEERTSAPATTRSRAARSTRCCARATPTAARPPRSRTTPASTRTRWAPGPPTPRPTSRTMGADDFRSNEKSVVIARPTARSRIELVGDDGTATVLQGVGPGARRRGRRRAPSCAPPRCDEFLAAQIARAKAEDVLFSVHLKATMMKVSDPIIFGHVVRAFFPDVFAQYGDDARRRRPDPEQRPRRASSTGLDALPDGRRDQGRHRRRARRRPRAGDGRLRQGHHQPARAERRHRRRLDAGDDPHLRPHVGPGRRGGRHPRRHPRQLATPASTRSSSTTAAPTAPSTRPRWARCPTSA